MTKIQSFWNGWIKVWIFHPKNSKIDFCPKMAKNKQKLQIFRKNFLVGINLKWSKTYFLKRKYRIWKFYTILTFQPKNDRKIEKFSKRCFWSESISNGLKRILKWKYRFWQFSHCNFFQRHSHFYEKWDLGAENLSIINNKEHQPSSVIWARLKCVPELTWSSLQDSRNRYDAGPAGGWICSFGEHASMGKGTYAYDSLKIHKTNFKI